MVRISCRGKAVAVRSQSDYGEYAGNVRRSLLVLQFYCLVQAYTDSHDGTPCITFTNACRACCGYAVWRTRSRKGNPSQASPLQAVPAQGREPTDANSTCLVCCDKIQSGNELEILSTGIDSQRRTVGQMTSERYNQWRAKVHVNQFYGE